MKTIYKTLMLGVVLATLAIISPTFAQDADVCSNFETNKALYDKYLNNYKGEINEKTVADRQAAVAAAKEYVDKYGACEAYKDQVDYLKKKGPDLDKAITAWRASAEKNKVYTQFDETVKSIKGGTGNVAGAFESGGKILADEPDFLDVMIVLATVGFDQSALNPPNNTYNAKTMDYAKAVIQKLDQNKESSSKKYGALGYEFDTKENTRGWMNYIIGYVMYYRQNEKEAALPYFYKAIQTGVETKQNPYIYGAIGDFYGDKAIKLGNEIVDIIKANNNQENYNSQMKFALQKGYADRAIDAYARAYQISKNDLAKAKPEEKAAKQKYTDELKVTLTNFYKFRYDTKENPLPADLDPTLNTYVASVINKPMPDPGTEVQPIDPPAQDEKTTDAASTTSMTPTTPTTATMPTTPKTSVKPAATGTTKPATNDAAVKTESEKTNNKPKKQ